jgi:hypothetical protein
MAHDHHGHGHHDHHGPGHNHDHAAPTHLHSHMEGEDRAEEIAMLAEQFLEGFREASDKASYLRLASVPLEIGSECGGKPLRLVDLTMESVYMPFPGQMIRERVNCRLTYVSLTERRDVDLRRFLAEKVRT